MVLKKGGRGGEMIQTKKKRYLSDYAYILTILHKFKKIIY